MTRGHFLKGCASGICSCAAVAFVPLGTTCAQSDPSPESPWKGKVEACQVRFAKLAGILNQNLDPALRKKIFESLGRECAKLYRDLTDKYRNDLRGFLATARTQWVESVEFDETGQTIRIVDKNPNCSCPLVKRGVTPPEFCDCTVGWQKEVYSAIVGRPVEAELEESVLRGGSRCIFRIRIG